MTEVGSLHTPTTPCPTSQGLFWPAPHPQGLEILFVLSIGSVFSWPTPVSPPGALPHLHPSSLLYFPVVPCQIGAWSAPAQPCSLQEGQTPTRKGKTDEGWHPCLALTPHPSLLPARPQLRHPHIHPDITFPES